jgi:group I intron endonuclease
MYLYTMVKIYYIAHPNNPNTPVYVGKTKSSLKKRLASHIMSSKKGNWTMANWIRKIINQGVLPVIYELDSVPESDWSFWEIYWINQLKAWGFKLKNISDGGQNGGLITHSEETKQKLRKSLTGRKLSKKHVENIKLIRTGWKLSQITKDKIRTKHTGKVLSNKTKQKISESKKGTISKKRIKILQTKADGTTKKWDSIVEAASTLQIQRSNVIACLKGRRTSANKSKWSYVDV